VTPAPVGVVSGSSFLSRVSLSWGAMSGEVRKHQIDMGCSIWGKCREKTYLLLDCRWGNTCRRVHWHEHALKVAYFGVLQYYNRME